MGILTDIKFVRSLQRRVANLPVGRKLSVGFGVVAVVLGFVVAGLFVTVDRLGSANHDIVAGADALAGAASNLAFAASELRAAQQGYVLSVAAGRSAFDRAAIAFESSLDQLRAATNDPVDLVLVRKISTDYQTFQATDQLIWAAAQEGDEKLARNLTLGPESLAFGFMANDAATLGDRAARTRDDAVRSFDDQTTRARVIGSFLGAGALMIMALASWLIARLIRDPLHRLQQAAQRAAEGDLDVQADVRGNDETGRLAFAFNSMLDKLRRREESLLEDHRRQETTSKVHRALEMADDEAMVLEVVRLTISEVMAAASVELLLADNSKANLEQAVVAGPNPDGPGCPVESPFSCVAVRSGSAVTFASSTSLDACPQLRFRELSACSATCVPVTFMGRAMGVIHAIGEENQIATPSQIEDLSMLATQSGARIGMLRTMIRTAEQAGTDSLTGLMNRRTFQTRTRSMRRRGVEFVLVMADIDHFKRINDTYGHETGDRAIKTFVDVATGALRQDDMMARWGGEEFTFAFADVDVAAASDAIDRIRVLLAGSLSTSDLPSFTVSYGIVAAGDCASLEDAVRLADKCLYEAKGNGRNCSVIADTTKVAHGTATSPAGARVAERPSPQANGVFAMLARDDDPLDT